MQTPATRSSHDAGAGGAAFIDGKPRVLQATVGAHGEDLPVTSGVAGDPSSGGHGTLAGELLVEDNAQVEHSVLMAYVGLGLDGDGAQSSFNEWPLGMGVRWSLGPCILLKGLMFCSPI